jgi:hypothetical protein
MKYRLSLLVTLITLFGLLGALHAQTTALDAIVDRAIVRERETIKALTNHSPMVETYLQHLDLHDQLGAVPADDRYFLGKLDLKRGINQKSLLPEPGFGSGLKDAFTRVFSIKYLPDGFAQMMFLDAKNFDRTNYEFTYVQREFLGDVRCVVFDVKPKPGSLSSHFQGRMWVEDQDYNLVRFNGTYGQSSPSKMFFHFDSWRENMAPGLWFPAYVYVEESDVEYALGRKLRFKGQTRFWGYSRGHSSNQTEWTAVRVDSNQIRDSIDQAEARSPIRNLRAWERQAEDNTLRRLQEAGLLAPAGQVSDVLETVITNLEVTNNLDIQPGIRARIMLTTPLESFTIGHTIVLSRGLVDVLPDEASLAMILAHELAHIALGHRLDTKFAFNDRMLFDDQHTFRRLTAKRPEKEEDAANKKAEELLRNSPYKDKLGNAGLFLRALDERASKLPQLLNPHMGNFMARGNKIHRMPELMKTAPELESESTKQIAALPLGGRLRVNPWDNTVELLKAEPVALLSAREKMPFEVTPVFLHLTRQSLPVKGAAATKK